VESCPLDTRSINDHAEVDTAPRLGCDRTRHTASKVPDIRRRLLHEATIWRGEGQRDIPSPRTPGSALLRPLRTRRSTVWMPRRRFLPPRGFVAPCPRLRQLVLDVPNSVVKYFPQETARRFRSVRACATIAPAQSNVGTFLLCFRHGLHTGTYNSAYKSYDNLPSCSVCVLGHPCIRNHCLISSLSST
jgi:hypothetical protein